jgi:hypothetical protein
MAYILEEEDEEENCPLLDPILSQVNSVHIHPFLLL